MLLEGLMGQCFVSITVHAGEIQPEKLPTFISTISLGGVSNCNQTINRYTRTLTMTPLKCQWECNYCKQTFPDLPFYHKNKEKEWVCVREICRVHKYFSTMTELKSTVSLNLLQTTRKSLMTCNAAMPDKELGKMLNPNNDPQELHSLAKPSGF